MDLLDPPARLTLKTHTQGTRLNKIRTRIEPEKKEKKKHIEAEKNRLNKELENITNEIEIIDKRLNNPSFIKKAPLKVVQDVKTKKTVFDQRKSEINKALLNL